MAVVDEFDPVNKHIKLANLTTINAQEIYNEAKDWEDDVDGIDNPSPMIAVGFAPLGGAAYTDKIFILSNGWKLKPYSGTYTLKILGTIITDDESAREVPPDSGTVHIVYQVCSQGILVVTGSGVTEQDKLDIRDYILNSTEFQLIKKIEANNCEIKNNQLIIYDDDGMTPLITFNLTGQILKNYAKREVV